MAFGSDSFPLGPNNRFPRKRMSSYGVMLIPPVSMQDTYLSGNNTVAKLPSTEKNYHTSVDRAKGRMKEGEVVRTRRRHMDIDRFRPRYAPPSSLRHALGQDEDMDNDSVYIERAGDEGEVDDSVGQLPSLFRGLRNLLTQPAKVHTPVPVTQANTKPAMQSAITGAWRTRPTVAETMRGKWGRMLIADKVLSERGTWGTRNIPSLITKIRGMEGLGALLKYTSSGRVIGSTWRYGKGTYYKTVRGSDGRIERGQIVGSGTKVIDYV